ncbi:MAG: homoserine dehydrogenase [Desulfobacterales bacterium]|nr:homoserine dehydrogenase [Desulfobacterales bacterium]
MKKRLILCGFGNVGRTFAQLITDQKQAVAEKYGLELELTAVVDIGGSAVAKDGVLPADRLLSHVKQGGSVETFESYGQPGLGGKALLASVAAEMLVETTPTNLVDAEPGRGHMLAALTSGKDIVTANKGPLVLFYKEIMDLAKSKKRRIYMSAATAAALPTLDVGLLCLAGAKVLAIEGILNGTTNYILTRMTTEKCSYEVALKAAQEMGIAETDPSLDVEGLDTRNKMILIANRLFDKNFSPADVPVTGITGITLKDIEKAKADGTIIKLIGECRMENGTVMLEVGPKRLGKDHPLSTVHFSEKGISYLSDTMGRVTVTGGKSSPVGAAAALLKDLIHASLFSADGGI